MSYRVLKNWIPSQETRDGEGVRIFRVAGRHLNKLIDPFLMIDEMRAMDSSDYIGGFPPHPHRGFETITYMLKGRFRHTDHMGNEGVIGPGDVQWMTAGRGVIHGEMPEQTEGEMHGFQIWINLPSTEKMKPAAYRDLTTDKITDHTTGKGVCLHPIAGSVKADGETVSGPLQGLSTDPVMIDMSFPKGASIQLEVPEQHNLIVYLYQGKLTGLPSPSAGIYSEGSLLILEAEEEGARALLLGGIPIKEPIVQHGPFVMNTVEEINQAIEDYQNGVLTD